MLNFRNTSVAFLVLLAIFTLASIYSVTGYVLMVILASSYLILLIYGSASIQSGFYLKALCRKSTKEKIIALTFDDGPDPEITPKVLDLLKKHQIQAIFFCTGKNIPDNHEILIRMVKEGHLIGNHSYEHPVLFDLWSSRQMLEDLNRAENTIAFASGQRPDWFRPPYGVTNPTVSRVVLKKNYRVMGWSIRSFDTSIKDPERIMERIIKRWHPGGILLMHDTNEKVIEVLKMVIEYARNKGYQFVRADKY